MVIIYLLSILCLVIVILILQVIKISISIYSINKSLSNSNTHIKHIKNSNNTEMISKNNAKVELKPISTIPTQSKIIHTSIDDIIPISTTEQIQSSSAAATTTTSTKKISLATLSRRDSRDIKNFNKYGLIPTKEFITNPSFKTLHQINNNIPLIAAGMRRKNLYVTEVDVYIVGIYMSVSKDTILSSISLQHGFKLVEYLSTPVISSLNSNNLTLGTSFIYYIHIIYIHIFI